MAEPKAKLLADEVADLAPGEGRCIDLPVRDLPQEAMDGAGRVQIRAVVRHGCDLVRANVEIFDDESGKTTAALPLQEIQPGC